MKKFLLAITILCTLVGVGTIGYSYKTYRDDKQTGEKIKSVAKEATEVIITNFLALVLFNLSINGNNIKLKIALRWKVQAIIVSKYLILSLPFS